MFIIFDSTTKQIHTVAESSTIGVPEGHERIEMDIQFSDLPATPVLCRYIDGQIIHDPSINLEPTDYVTQRVLNYPTITDQLDMLWHAIDTGTLDKSSQFYTILQAVKEQFPKT